MSVSDMESKPMNFAQFYLDHGVDQCNRFLLSLPKEQRLPALEFAMYLQGVNEAIDHLGIKNYERGAYQYKKQGTTTTITRNKNEVDL